MIVSAPGKSHAQRRTLRIGSVSFLNARPLIYGLEEEANLELGLAVPSQLLPALQEERFDVALLPVIDYPRVPGARLLGCGGIGCDGPTLTVRIFSATPVEQIQTLACDTDSHTSVALARILLARRWGIHPEFVPLDRQRAGNRAALLLIGDKVVCEEPCDLPHQLDLGQVWKEQTGLPFVFAAWMARGGVELGDLPAELQRAKRRGLAHVDEIVARYAVPRGWPAGIARRYLTENLKYDIGPRELEAIRLFLELAAEHSLLPGPPPPLCVI